MAPQPHTSEVEKRMRMFGEAARGSSERFEKLVEVYSRVESNNRVNLEDFYVLRDADVDIAEIVSEKAGFSQRDIIKAVIDGKNRVRGSNKTLSRATGEGDKFYSKTVRETKTLAQAQQQPAKMS